MAPKKPLQQVAMVIYMATLAGAFGGVAAKKQKDPTNAPMASTVKPSS
jgi:hypothetical protein